MPHRPTTAARPEILELFDRAVTMHAHRTAVEGDGRALTYAQLAEAAGGLEGWLTTHGVEPGDVVALHLERSVELVVAMLAVLNCGAAFLPLDPDYPQERLRYLIDDASPSFVLEASARRTAVGGAATAAERDDLVLRRLDGRPPGVEGLAYLNYTSGSTGKPKGAMLGHAGLANLARAKSMIPGDRILQIASPSFDATIWEIFPTLAWGATIVLTPAGTVPSGSELVALLEDLAITEATIVPSVLATANPAGLTKLRRIVSAGEQCPDSLAAAWAEGRRLVNAYGPTETTVCATRWIWDNGYEPPMTIGRPLPNVSVYVLDEQGQPVPAGSPGELYIGGLGVGLGYLRRPEETARRFVRGPGGERLYRSGDLVRELDDGRLVFLGRVDDQIKLRGVRVEPGEIVAVLDRHPSVRASAVAVKRPRGGEPRICAYVLPAGEPGSVVPAEVQRFARDHLMRSTVPSAVIEIAEFPLTPNGKLDAERLPDPQDAAPRAGGPEPAAPASAHEEALLTATAAVLGLDTLTLADNFFDVGGDSIAAGRIVARLRRATGSAPPLAAFFEGENLAEVAAAAAAAAAGAGNGRSSPRTR